MCLPIPMLKKDLSLDNGNGISNVSQWLPPRERQFSLPSKLQIFFNFKLWILFVKMSFIWRDLSQSMSDIIYLVEAHFSKNKIYMSIIHWLTHKLIVIVCAFLDIYVYILTLFKKLFNKALYIYIYKLYFLENEEG